MSTDPVCKMVHFDLTDWNAVARDVVQMLRPVPVYSTSKLHKGSTPISRDNRSNHAQNEAKRREAQREIFQDLSRYYELPRRKKQWRCPQILDNGKHGHSHSSVISLAYLYSLSVPRHRHRTLVMRSTLVYVSMVGIFET